MTRPATWGLLLALPLAGLVLLLAVPELDVQWEHHPGHFWLVIATGMVSLWLGFLLAEAAARRGDARVLLVSCAFLASSGFLVLHALATPGVLLSGKNAGFQIASPIGLLLAGAFASGSALELPNGAARHLVLRRRVLYGGLLAVMGVWGVVSLTTLPPLDDPIAPEETRGPFLGLFAAGALLYLAAAWGYRRLRRLRSTALVLAVVAAWALLAEAMLAVALSRSWHATWWEWHLLMLIAFGLVARGAWREWQHEGSTAEIFSDIYEQRTLGHPEEVSVLFADLQGYTSYSERTPQPDVRAMLNEYFTATVPAVESQGGEIVQTIGDAVMAVFRGSEHAVRASRAGVSFQEAAGRLAEAHPDWPRFRVGIDSGFAHVGLVRAPGARIFTPTGDVVNVAARIETQARTGEVVVSEATRAALGADAELEDLGEVELKGKAEPVRIFLLRSLSSQGNEGEQRLDDQDPEPER
ncbi:MAG: adenylate/guanylate cyclase domain-containing protein [Gaiellaceae bacterium]